MEYNLNLNDRAWDAIRAKTKRIEIRTNTEHNKTDFNLLKTGDIIIFGNSSKLKIKCLVEEVNWYKTIEELLILEGTRYTLSSTNDFDEGVVSINNIPNYKDSIKKHGVFAIHIEFLGTHE